MKKSVPFMIVLKNNYTFPDHPATLPEMVAKWCADEPWFDDFFVKTAVLVPVPRHHPIKPGSLWVPKVIADSLKQHGLGSSVIPCLERTEKVLQSSKSTTQDRPDMQTHYKTMRVKNCIAAEPQDVLLVDDVVTSGATIAASYRRMAEAYPNARIKAFAAMSASFPDEFRLVEDARTGTIEIDGLNTEKRFDD